MSCNTIRIRDAETFAKLVRELTLLGVAFNASDTGEGEFLIEVTGV